MALAARKTVGVSTAPALRPQNGADLVNMATLVRGRVYYYKDERFDINAPKEVSKKMADDLEELYDETSDSEGERFEKPFFRVERDISRPLAATPFDPRRPVRRLPVLPAPPKH